MHDSDFCVQPVARRTAPSVVVGRFLRFLYRRLVFGEQAWPAEFFHWRRGGVFRGAYHVFHICVAIWPPYELADRRRGVRLALRMAGDTDRPARRLADRRGREFLHGVFMRDIGVGQRHESPMAAERTVSFGGAASDILRRDDRPEQFSRYEAKRKTDHSDVCRVACLHAGVMGRLHGARIVCQDGLIERHKRHKGQKRQKRQPIGDAVCLCAPAEYWKNRPFILY